MKNINFVVILLALSLFAAQANAQRYKTAVGIRIERGVNITAQQYLFNDWTAEGILHTHLLSKDFGFTLLAEKHRKIVFRGFNIYGGGGVHYYGQSLANKSETEIRNNVFGLSLIGGAELSIGRLNLAVDFKPELHLSGDQVHPFEWSGPAVSVRYILAKRERKKVKDWDVWDKFKRD